MSVRHCNAHHLGSAPQVLLSSVTAVKSPFALQRTFDGTLDFTTPQADILQFAIAQSFELKSCLAFETPSQIGNPPSLHPG
jgi:hypothetical protein